MPSISARRHLASEWRGDRLVRSWGSASSEEDALDRSSSLILWLRDTLSRTFLPEGYPSSVSSDYLGETWHYMHALHRRNSCINKQINQINLLKLLLSGRVGHSH